MADIDFGGSPTDPALVPLATATYLFALEDTGVGAEPLVARVVATSEIAPLNSPTFTGTVTGITAAMVGAPSGSGTSSGTNTGDQTITLTGEVTGSGTGSFAVTVTNSAVIGKVLTGFTSGAGTVAATDTILDAIEKLDGNVAGKQDTLVSGTNIKTVGGVSLLGSGDVPVGGATVISNTQTGTQNDWAPTGLSGNTLIRWAGTSPLIVTGFASPVDGQIVTFRNVGTSVAVFQHQASGSTAANRLVVADTSHLPVWPGDTMAWSYRGSDSRWVIYQTPLGGVRTFGVHYGQRPGLGSAPSTFGLMHTSAGASIGTQGATSGAALSTALARTSCTTAASTGSNTGTIDQAQKLVGSVGYLYSAVWHYSGQSHPTMFVGGHNGNSALGNVDYGGITTAKFGFGRDPADPANLHLLYSDGTTAHKVDLGSSFDIAAGNVFEGYIYCPPGSTVYTSVIWRKDDISIAPDVRQISVDTPGVNLNMSSHIEINNRTTATASAVYIVSQDLWRH